LTVALTWSVGQLQAQQPGAIQYFYDDLGRLIMVIDADGNAAEYVYDAVGNILEIKRLTFSGLAILNFTPSQGPVGTRVTLQGQGFSATPSENTVTFNGTGAAVLSATQTSLVVTVPPGATTGPIAVTVAGNTATSDRQFSVLPTPEITSVMPSVALAGSVLPNLRVQGRHLEGATFTFVSVKPLVTITSVTIDPTGTSATLNVTVRANTAGTAVVMATSKAFVSSDATPTTANTLRIRLAIQRGTPPARLNVLDATPRYLRHGRDLSTYVHKDFTYQAFLHAGLILLAMRAPFQATNPYRHSRTQSGFVTFGAPDVLDLVGRVANAALKATWCQKWLVHRRLRPEEFAGRVHQTLSGAVRYPIHTDVLNAVAPSTLFHTTGTYLLPMAYPEGCPLHPAYPAGHAAIAGACVTVLKAFFQPSFVIPKSRRGECGWVGAPALSWP
jgi:YD repeat-containing protein